MKQHRGIFWTLGLSLAVNLLIIGALLGLGLANRHQKPDPVQTSRPPIASQTQAFNTRLFYRALPVAEQRKARRLLRNSLRERRHLTRKIHQSRRNLYVLLLEEHLDQPKIDIALSELREAELSELAFGQALILEILTDLEPATRKQVLLEITKSPSPRKRQQRQNNRQKQREN